MIKRTMSMAILIAFMAVLLPPAGAQDPPGRRYAFVSEYAEGPFAKVHGASVQRTVPNIDTRDSGDPACVNRSVAQIQWIINYDQGWVEFGTIHQCGTNLKRDFAAVGSYVPGTNGSVIDHYEYLRLEDVEVSNDLRRFTINSNSTSWKFSIDGVLFAETPIGGPNGTGLRYGTHVDTGVEMTNNPLNPIVPVTWSKRLRIKTAYGGWQEWAGQDNIVVEDPWCGQWADSTDDAFKVWRTCN